MTEATSKLTKWYVGIGGSWQREDGQWCKVADAEQQIAEAQSKAFLLAAQYLREYFDNHRLPLEDLVSDQITRGVCDGRQDALNVLFLRHLELQKQGQKS